MQIPPEFLAAFWSDGRHANATLDPDRFYEAFAFGDSEGLAAELGELVLRGVKRATASLVWTYEVENKPQPKAGDFSIVTSWGRQPLCIIETTDVEIVGFEDVSENFARTEGEGDGSLASWTADHMAFFARECRRIARLPDARMPVVCERLRVVYRP
jgi:uncharacterized protein YhfF